MAGAARLLTEDGHVACERCVVADAALARMKGLLGRKELPAGEGILIRPCNSIHMFFMRFPIDAIFLDRAGKVVKVAENVKLWRMAWARRAHAVIEIAAGEAARRKVTAGDELAFDG
jgi:uncharacterized membrane protein (UPF0127 family)